MCLRKELFILLFLSCFLVWDSSQATEVPLSQLKSWRNELTVLNLSLKKKSEELQQLREDLKKQESTLTEQSKKLKDLEKQIEDLQKRIETLLSESQILQKDLEKIKKGYQQLLKDWNTTLAKEKEKTDFWRTSAISAFIVAAVELVLLFLSFSF